MNLIVLENDILKEFFWSSNIDKLIISLLYLPKEKKDLLKLFYGFEESVCVLPITKKKYIMTESNQGFWWWRNQIEERRDFSCKISNETVAKNEISFKEKNIQYFC